MKYSAFSLFKNALSGHRHWPEMWRKASPKSHYDVIIIGGGGHGLATAYYLAKNHGITNVAVIEKGWIGGGNVGRNTTIVRSNYMHDENAHFYEHSLKLWEGLAQDINFNLMFSQRGVLNLAHNDGQVDAFQKRGNQMRLNGIDAEYWDVETIRRKVPYLDTSANTRYPIFGGLIQKRGGSARHDSVAWGFARAADSYGIDIIEQCEVTGIQRDGETVTGIDTTRGFIGCDRIGIAVAGHSSHVAAMLDVRLPIESHVLQALVSEPVKPMLDYVVTSAASHMYISQTDKGELIFGGDLDFYPSYAQRGNFPRIEAVIAAASTLFPVMSRMRLMRTWGGIMDMSPDGSPIIDKLPFANAFINTGWCYGGFKATPGSGWCFAHTIATGEAHELNRHFRLDRFHRGYVIDELGAGARHNAH